MSATDERAELVERELAGFVREAKLLCDGNEVAHCAFLLRAWSRFHPQQGSLSAVCEVMADALDKAAPVAVDDPEGGRVSIDYRELLRKYIQHIRDKESISYLENERRGGYTGDVEFTDEEWNILRGLAGLPEGVNYVD